DRGGADAVLLFPQVVVELEQLLIEPRDQRTAFGSLGGEVGRGLVELANRVAPDLLDARSGGLRLRVRLPGAGVDVLLADQLLEQIVLGARATILQAREP